ncbi:MAG: beta strand repeat-containing protein [Ferruginibacter sp.]
MLVVTLAGMGGEALGQTTLTVVPSAANTGTSGISYVTTATVFTNQSINWSINNWIPNTIEVRGNQGSAASNFQFSNTSAIAGTITKVTITSNGGTLVASNIFLLMGTTAQSGTTGGTAGTMNGNDVEWTVSGSNTFFQIYFANGGTSGTTTITNIIIQYSSGTNFYWNGSTISGTGIATGGTGTWNTSTTNWRNPNNSASDVSIAWTNSTSNVANFSAGSGTVTMGTDITANSTVIGAAGYTLAPSATIALNSPVTLNNTLTVGPAVGTFTMTGVITGTGGITQNGAGTTVPSGLNTYTGPTTINAGTLSISTIANGGSSSNIGASTNAAGNFVLGGGTLVYAGTTASTDRNFTLTAGVTSTINVTNTTTALTISGAAATTTGALTKAGFGKLTLSGTNAYTGATTISAGTLQLGAPDCISNSSNLVLTGGTFSTGASTGYNETLGSLELSTADSYINLGPGVHTLTFTGTAPLWIGSIVLTIDGWNGPVNGNGTEGRIFVPNSTYLSATQLAKVTFAGYAAGATIIANGSNWELAPYSPPTLSTNPSAFSGMYYIVGNGPSGQFGTFTVSGTYLNFPGNILVDASSTSYEVSLDNSTFFNTVSISYSTGTLNPTNVYVRLKAGLSVGSYNNQSVAISIAGAISTSVICSGEVYASATVTIDNPTAVAVGNILTGSTNNVIYSFRTVASTGVYLNSVTLPFTATRTADFNNVFNLYYNSSNTISGATLAASVNPAGGNIVFSGGQNISAATIYWFVTADVQAGAIVNNTIRVNAPPSSNFNINAGVTKIGTPLAGGTQTIVRPTAVTDYFRSNVTTGNWATAANWQSSVDGSTNWITSTSVPTNAATGISILSGQSITVSSPATGVLITVNSGSTLILNSSLAISNMTGTDLTVDGILTRNLGGSLTNAGTAVVNATGIYNNYSTTGNNIMIATWNSASNCNMFGFTGASNSGDASWAQTFGNMTWDGSTQSANGFINVENSSFAVAGTLTINSSLANFSLGSAAGTYTNTAGNLIINGGVFNVSGANPVSTLSVVNDATINAGVLNVSFGNGTSRGTLNVGRDLTIAGTGKINLQNGTTNSNTNVINVTRDFVASSTSVASVGANGIVDFGAGTTPTNNAINIGRNFTKSGIGTFGTSSSSPALGFVFTGGTVSTPATISYSGANSNSTSYLLSNTSVVQLLTILTLGTGTNPASYFTANGTLNFQTFSLIAGNTTDPRFLTSSTTTLITSNTNGIGGNTATGSLQNFGSVSSNSLPGRAQFATGISYVYNGATTTPFPIATVGSVGTPANITINANVTSNQSTTLVPTGAFLVNSPATYTMNAQTLSLNNGSLTIASGATFDNAGENQIQSGGGTPTITINGRFITRDVEGFTGTNTSIPGIAPTLNTGCTIEYAFAGNQSVSIRTDYTNINIVNGGIKTLVTNSPVTPIAGTVTVADATTLDVANNSFGNAATNLTLLLTAKFINGGSGVKPDIGGTFLVGVGSTFEFSGTSATIIRQEPRYYNLVVSGSNVSNSSTINGISFQAGGSFTVKGGATFRTTSPAGLNNIIGSVSTAISNVAPSNPLITLEPNSTIEYAGAEQTITNTNLTSPTTGNYYNLTLSGTGAKMAPSSNLTILGNLSRSGLHTFSAGTGRVTFAGSVMQTYSAAAGTQPINFYNVTNSNTVRLQLDSTIGIQNEFDLSAAAKLHLNTGDINMRSTAARTAYITDLGTTTASTNITYNTGRFSIERYLRAYKSWRLLATPVDIATSPTITNSWREGENVGTYTANGYGTRLTGPEGGSGSPTMDEYTQRASMKSFNAGLNIFDEINTFAKYANPIANLQGYFVFVRGDRGVNINGAAGITNLRIRGRIRTGNQTFNVPHQNTASGGFQSIGNPFASQIKVQDITKNSITNAIVIWDPTASGSYNVGGYKTYSWNGTNYVRTPFDGTTRDYIESGEAFFVQNNTLSGDDIIIKEIDKTIGSNLVSREGSIARTGISIPTLEINMHAKNTDGTEFLADGIKIEFDDFYNNSFDFLDVRKINNSYDNLAIKSNDKNLVVERRKPITIADTIFLSLTSTRVAPYRFEIDPSVLGNLALEAFLKDNFLQTETPVSLTNVTNVNFNITSDAASRAADRFMIVFKPSIVVVVLPVSFTTISAEKNADKTNTIKWNTANEINISSYHIERSINGIGFSAIGTMAATGNNGNSSAYSFVDAAPLAGLNYYRVKAISANGQLQYSTTVKLSSATIHPAFSIQPNPVINKTLHISFQNMEGLYSIRLTTKQGATVLSKQITIAAGNQAKEIALGDAVAAGVYDVVLLDAKGKQRVQTIFIQ